MLDRENVEQAISYFQTVMDQGDEALKRKTINYITETWVSANSPIALSKSRLSYAKFLSDYMNATFKGKESTMNADDHYTAGLIFWSFAYSGALNQTSRAISQLNAAARGGNTDAVLYLAAAVKQMKNQDPGIQWGDIIDLYTQAAIVKKTPQPLISLGNSKLADLKWSTFNKFKTAADLDTARNIFLASLNNVMQAVPDSFHVAVNSFWERSFSGSTPDTAVTNLIKIYFAQVTVPSSSPARKGFAWHRLYEYFYEAMPEKNTTRPAIMKELKAYYNNDRELLAVIADFLNTAQPGEMGFALSIDSKWLTAFSPMQVNDPESFFSAAAMTDQDYLAFLEKNQPASRFTKQIAQGYRKRFNQLFDIATSKIINDKYKMALAEVGSSANMRLIETLAAYPDISGNSAIKYVYADMAVLNNLSSYVSLGGGIPMRFDELGKVYNKWSAADKKGYNRQYIDFLLEKVQELVTSRKSVNSLAQATGKSTLDFNDYDKAQKTIDQITAALQIK
ncbi:hypothetical protein L3C95_09470 [Chitinophaga filiformis]|uniref:hypothetical protein n=1 Tax=Chitinophaga filiformis TaxID=104663 RepID=UPI001F16498E|nr:hypothetical protein [Chitinophaga filiformis]MCF6403102.1 hypothetical protein [Chitinophaga filiformis]